ncbi:hypothetical protein HHK36_001771 [Tetracentron sinense]|uniref:Uncharacterized protein n=1 Tax=Tetracentron sinense TaxID=13715 RepID=A0A835DSC8_TETSI|nr:hypothetical protein HHK36_001771 [Tetracentron sinense]
MPARETNVSVIRTPRNSSRLNITWEKNRSTGIWGHIHIKKKKLTPMALQSLVFSLLTILLVVAKTEPVLWEYTSIFSFGDSYTDTGNLICLYPNESGFHFPYGETYFGHPTGRYSNGRLIVDFLVTDCSYFFSRSLFLVGEIGGNDYVYSFRAGRSLEEIRTFVPDIIDAISSAIQLVVKHGAVTVMVPGNIPMGCLSLFLTQFQSSNEEDYDPQTGCLRWLNEFSMYHNHLLQKELNRMQELHPHVTFIYADYYNASMRFFRHPHQFGFSKGSLTACCGGGGPYNYNKSLLCGNRSASVLNDPSLYADWDGKHMTEAAYKTIASYILQGFKYIPDSSHQYLTLFTSKEYRASLLQNS